MTWWPQLRALLRRDFLTDVRYPIAFAMGLADAVVILISYSYLAGVFGDRRPDGYEPLPFLLVGVALTDALSTALVCLALGVRSSQQPGTVKAMLTLPLPSSRLMLMSMTYPFIRAALDFVIFMTAACVLGISLTRANILAMLAVFVLALCSIGVWGLVSASLTMIVKRGDPVLWIVGTATWLLSGVLYPTNVLPAFLQWLSWLLPTTHALAAMRAAVIDGASWRVMAPDLGALAVFDLIGIPLGLWCYGLAVNYAKRAGTLSHA